LEKKPAAHLNSEPNKFSAGKEGKTLKKGRGKIGQNPVREKGMERPQARLHRWKKEKSAPRGKNKETPQSGEGR